MSPPQSVDEKVVDVDDVTTDDNILEIESDIWIDIPDDLSSDEEAAPGQINQHHTDTPIGFTRLCQELRVDAGLLNDELVEVLEITPIPALMDN